jgi:ADP-glucose pyrophosphorylase
VIGRGAKVYHAIIGENAHIGEGAVIGGELRPGETVDNKLTGDITVVGNDICIPAGGYLPRGVIAAEGMEDAL